MRWIVGLAALVTVGCNQPNELDRARAETTKVLVNKFAFEAYPMWQIQHRDACPTGLDDLEKLVDKKAIDAYHQPLVMLCGDDAPKGAEGFGVLSLGPDGERGTDDDIVSWVR